MPEATGERIELRDGSARARAPDRARGPRRDPCGGVRAPQRRVALPALLLGEAALSDAELTYLTEVDHHDHEALLAFDADSGLGIGVARFVRNHEDAGLAEAAVTVTDDAQGRGLGTALLSRLADRAREEGVDRFSALVLADNRDMLDLLERAGEVRRRDVEAGVVEIEIALEPPGAGVRLQQLLREAAEGLIAVVARLRGD